MVNLVSLMGRMVADAELRATTDGKSVTSFTVAVERDYVKSGEERQTDFINIVAWRNTAEFISRNFHKGDMIAIVGSIQVRNFTDKNGNKRYATEVLAEKVSFCGGKKESSPNLSVTPGNDFEEVGNDDDLPF